MKKLVGIVSVEERDEILAIFERRNGLIELSRSLVGPSTELYERVVMDLGTTTTRFQNWWNSMSERYGWESAPDGNWEINFYTCEIFLVK